jgi:hypothetical protein
MIASLISSNFLAHFGIFLERNIVARELSGKTSNTSESWFIKILKIV